MKGKIILEFRKAKAVQEYSAGKISISEAARNAKVSIWGFEQYAVQNGYKSSYSIEDLEEEIK